MGMGGIGLASFLEWSFLSEGAWFLKQRHIGTFGDLDADGIVLPGHQVISFECSPKLVGLNAHNGISCLVEVFASAENLSGHGIALYFVGSPGQHGFHNER